MRRGWVNCSSKHSFFHYSVLGQRAGRHILSALYKHSRTKLPLTHRSTTFRPPKPKTVYKYTAELDVYSIRAAINILLRFHTIYIFHSEPLCCPDGITFVFMATIDFFFVSVYLWGAGILNYYQPLKFRFNINWSFGKSLIFIVQCFLYRNG